MFEIRTSLLILAAIVAVPAPPLAAQTPVRTGTPAPYTPLSSVTLPSDLERVLRDYERAWRTGDETALAALFTPDGFVPTGLGWVRGTGDIQATYANAGGDLQLRALAYAVADTVGYIVGAYGYGDQPGPPDRGKFVLALRRAPNDQWLIAADLDNANRP